jgi:predicted enzyme related to lactoylglutathione lyase
LSNPIVWWELATHDQEKSVKFFQNVFDWDIQLDPKAGFYKMKHEPPQITGGGIFTLKRAKLPFISLYIQVEDINTKAKEVEENGGLVTDAPFEISPGVWLCLFNEPSGVEFAMIAYKDNIEE